MRKNPTRNSKRRGRQAQQLQLLPEDEDIRRNRKARGVYRDRNAHQAIVYDIARMKILFVEMRRGRLVTSSLPDAQFFTVRQFERIEYPVERAIEDFLAHGGGISEAAQRALLTFLHEARREGRAPLPLFS